MTALRSKPDRVPGFFRDNERLANARATPYNTRMKQLIVMKFGGAAVKDSAGFARCAKIVCSRPDITPVVIVSAMGEVTDKLTTLITEAGRDPSSVASLVEELREKHTNTLNECVADENIRKSCQNSIDEVLAGLQKILGQIADAGGATPEMKDAAIVTGERLSVRVLAAVLNQTGCPAQACDADDMGIMTDGVFGAASPLMEDSEANLRDTVQPMIERGEVAVVTGFFGRDAEGRPTTFGRGGSDFSAAILANVLKADEVEVWKDVPGFMSADPRTIPDATHIDEMCYEEAAELSYFGAKILHPRTVEPVMDRISRDWPGEDPIQGYCDFLNHRIELATDRGADVQNDESFDSWASRGFPGFSIGNQ